MKSKKIIAGMLAMAFVFGGTALPTYFKGSDTVLTASAEVEKNNGTFRYQVIRGGKEIEILGLVKNDPKEIKIPETIDGLPVTQIGPEAFYNKDHNTKNTLQKVSLPNSIEVIGRSAFAYNEALIQMNVPTSLKTIEASSFEGCKQLGAGILPNTLTSIGDMAFYGCEKMSNIALPASVTSIGDKAFTGCGTKVNNGKNFYIKCFFGTAAEDYAFDNYIAYELIDEDKSTTLKDNGIYNKMYRYTLINGGKEIRITKGKYTLETVEIPEKIGGLPVTEIGTEAFYNDEHKDKNVMKKVVLPKTIKKIDDAAFADNEKLSDINIPDSVTYIGARAFEVCKSLEKITLPEGLKTIGDQAFTWCQSLTSVTIPASVSSIGEKAFFNCGTITGSENFFIYCTKGTAGEKYAIDNGIEHEAKTAKGDVNADGKIDIEDAVMVINNVNGQKALSNSESARANVDGNDKVDIEDAVAIISHVNGVKSIA